MDINVRQAGEQDRDAVIEAFAHASRDEVVTAWVLEGFPFEQFSEQYVPVLIDRALRDDEIWVAGDDSQIWAVSIWQQVDSVDRFQTEAAEARAAAEGAPDVPTLRRFAVVTDLLAHSHPCELPHRYLQVIVTVPEHRGKGAGAAILADRTKAASSAGVPAYLEASTERSARLYTRMGFARTGAEHELPEGGPTLRPMWFRG
ncbi:acetyltransferase (GNAT) family protein [Nocardia tenerifensis]|uniref:Acetyltransferase (GNAT) family protein n=1 Tax=Nocardia tenerifensis TaxID=228006 RepID=A0A318JWP7_9NOCA|nr:GNAT family N-acetyltransferase [Nocardia tenerifensis]PXX62220.1 acetyltransferase (GNAT) family protein [Nocardia tenerifensis]